MAIWSPFSETKWTGNAPRFYFRRKTAQLDFRRAKPLRQLFRFGPRAKHHQRHQCVDGAADGQFDPFAAAAESYFVLMFFFPGLQLFQILVETIKTFFPKCAIFLDPRLRLLHRLGLQFQRMHPTVATASGSNPRFPARADAFETAGNSIEYGPGQEIGDAAVTMRQVLQNAPARRVGQRGKRAVQQTR